MTQEEREIKRTWRRIKDSMDFNRQVVKDLKRALKEKDDDTGRKRPMLKLK